MRHSIRVIVQIGEEFGSVRMTVEGDEDAFDEVDMAELAEIAARGLSVALTGSDEEEDEDEVEMLMLPLFDDEDDDDGNHTLN